MLSPSLSLSFFSFLEQVDAADRRTGEAAVAVCSAGAWRWGFCFCVGAAWGTLGILASLVLPPNKKKEATRGTKTQVWAYSSMLFRKVERATQGALLFVAEYILLGADARPQRVYCLCVEVKQYISRHSRAQASTKAGRRHTADDKEYIKDDWDELWQAGCYGTAATALGRLSTSDRGRAFAIAQRR